jgi:hypothetical protein
MADISRRKLPHLPQADTEGYGTPNMGDPLLVTLHVLHVLAVRDFGKLQHASEGAADSIGRGEDAEQVIGRYTGSWPRRVRKEGAVAEMAEDEDVDVAFTGRVCASDWRGSRSGTE